MAGLFALIWGALYGTAKIKEKIDDHQAKKTPAYYTKDGDPIYIDSQGRKFVNGERAIPVFDPVHHEVQYRGKYSNVLYESPYENQMANVRKWDEKYKQDAIDRGYTSYLKYDERLKVRVTTEMSTGKVIASLVYNQDTGECYKTYMEPGASVASASDGIRHPISAEEYKKLDITCGSHFRWPKGGLPGYVLRQLDRTE